MSKDIAILGTGAWGCALGNVMARAGHHANLWGRNQSQVDEINNTHTNRQYLGDIALDKSIKATTDMKKAVENAEVILLVTPAQTVAEICAQMQSIISPDQIIIACAKGIDRHTGNTPAETIAGFTTHQNIGVLSGPSFASDVASRLPTAVTLAFSDMNRSLQYARMMSCENFRIYASDDLVGVELGGALKNVVALAVGVARGMGLGASAEAALIARGFGELRRLAIAMGAKPETLSGLSGLGDLVLTASSTQSRNFSYGVALGRGENTKNLPLAEGTFSAQIASVLANKHDVDAPIIHSIGEVVAGIINAQDAVQQLLSRPLKAENA